MNRTYFKAKCLSNGSWVIGNYWHRTEGDFIVCGECKFPVDPGTLCQCTGLVDSKGRDVFENDVIQTASLPSTTIFAVLWKSHRYVLKRKDEKMLFFVDPEEISKDSIVVGNIYDEK